MNNELVTHVFDLLCDAKTAIVETEHRIGGDPNNGDARRSLARVRKAVTSALKLLDPEYEDE